MKISMEKVLLINGSPHAKGRTYTALREVADSLEKNGVATEIVHLGPRGVPGCMGCYVCQKTDRCAMDDLVNTLVERLDEKIWKACRPCALWATTWRGCSSASAWGRSMESPPLRTSRSPSLTSSVEAESPTCNPGCAFSFWSARRLGLQFGGGRCRLGRVAGNGGSIKHYPTYTHGNNEN